MARDADDDAPDLDILVDEGVRVALSLGNEPVPAVHVPQALQRAVAVDKGDDDRARARRLGSVDDDQVAIVDAGTQHGMAVDAHDVARRGVLDEPGAEVDRLLHVVLCRRRKASRGARQEERHLERYQVERDIVEVKVVHDGSRDSLDHHLARVRTEREHMISTTCGCPAPRPTSPPRNTR